jgi:signal transduction histidine kinase
MAPKQVLSQRRCPQILKKALYSTTRRQDGGISWLIALRWVACAGLFFVIWLSSTVLDVVSNPLPLYIVGLSLVAYNLLFRALKKKKTNPTNEWMVRTLFWQITIDLIALTLLLYFSGISHNPFIFYFVFHIIIAAILLPEPVAYLEALLASLMVGAVMLMQYHGFIPEHKLEIAFLHGGFEGRGIYLLGKFIALCSTLLLATYFTVSVLSSVRHAELEIRQREKYSSLGQLVSGILHQIRNPLDGLKNCLHRITDKSAPEESTKLYVQLMNEEIDRIEQLTYRLQDYARPHNIKIQPIDINQEVSAALRLLEVKDNGNIKIQKEFGEVSKAMGDPFALQEVLINFCTNACSAMPGGGTLTVRTYQTSIKLARQVRGVAVEIEDTGVGFNPENELIFEPFYTTKASAKGTGLGLWICELLVSRMGGQIQVESTPGKGSIFRILLEAF